MKLVLHYLRYDWKRSRVLLHALWSLLALHGVMVWLGQEELKVSWMEEYYRAWIPASCQNAAFICRILCVLSAVVLCLAAGRADSPVQESWLRTRPGRGWRLWAAHWLGIVLGVVLPLTLSYTVALVLLHFDGATILYESLQMLGCTAAAATMLVLWGLASPSFSGVVLGIGAAVLAGVSLFVFNITLPAQWLLGTPHPTAIMLVLMLPALCGLRRAPNSRQRLLAGFGTGAALAAVLYLMPLGRHLTAWTGPDRALERRAFGNNEEEWNLLAIWPAVMDPPGLFNGTRPAFSMRVAGRSFDKGVHLRGGSLSEISWRASSSDEWSEWQACEGEVVETTRPSRSREWLLRVDAGFDDLESMEDGELRVRAILLLSAESKHSLANVQGSVARGPGWVMEVMRPQADDETGWLQTASRQAFFSRHGKLRAGAASGSDLNNHFFPGQGSSVWSGTRDFIRTSFPVYFIVPRSAEVPAGNELTLYYQSPDETYSKVLHITGVQLTRPRRPPPRQKVEPEPVKKTERHFSPAGKPVYPWPAAQELKIPGPDATAVEVSNFLHRLAAKELLADEDGLVGLLPRWLPLILEMEARHPNQMLRDALITGAAEEQRNEILRHLPVAPTLVQVALRRGWAAEARPWILRLVERRGGIPPELLTLCRSYRDPAFNAVMRKSWKVDEATVAYWESMPALAAELPARLAEVKELFLRRGLGFGEDQRAAVLLRRGDKEVLEVALQRWRRETNHSWDSDNPLRRFLRSEDGQLLPGDINNMVAMLGQSAADYDFDAARHCFIRKKKTP